MTDKQEKKHIAQTIEIAERQIKDIQEHKKPRKLARDLIAELEHTEPNTQTKGRFTSKEKQLINIYRKNPAAFERYFREAI